MTSSLQALSPRPSLLLHLVLFSFLLFPHRTIFFFFFFFFWTLSYLRRQPNSPFQYSSILPSPPFLPRNTHYAGVLVCVFASSFVVAMRLLGSPTCRDAGLSETLPKTFLKAVVAQATHRLPQPQQPTRKGRLSFLPRTSQHPQRDQQRANEKKREKKSKEPKEEE